MPRGRPEHGRIALGEYEYAGASVPHLRDLFLLQVRKDVPNVLTELGGLDRPLTIAALRAWAARWHLHAPWLLVVAHRTLTTWDEMPSLARVRQWAPNAENGVFVPEPFSITWAPTIETEREFRDRIEQYLVDVRAWAQRLPLAPAPSKPTLTRDLSALVAFQVKGDTLGTVAATYFGASPASRRSEDAARRALRRRYEDAARKALVGLATSLSLTLRK